MTAVAQLSTSALRIDAEATIDVICRSLREMLRAPLRRRGLVVGLSGGVDSSVVVALAARAIGPDRVLALVMPETDSASESARRPLGAMISRTFVSQENLPAPPHGYEVVKFRTRFANNEEAIETVTLDREDGAWHVVGVTIG